MILGAHVPQEEPLAEAESIKAECLQMFIGDPQSFKKPPPRDDAEELRSADIPVYIHAPYRINVASPNNRIRIPSRKLLAQTLDAAAEVDAAAVIVHGGHADDGVEEGFIRWKKALEQVEARVPIFIENTAGGDNAMTRYVDTLAKLWDELDRSDVGFCFDTCHAHAAGEDLENVVPRVLDAVGKIDLVHANSSRDEPGTGADRHASFEAGRVDPEAIAEMVRQAKAPAVICETPYDTISNDLEYLRAHL